MIFYLGCTLFHIQSKSPFLAKLEYSSFENKSLPLSKSVVGTGEEVGEKCIEWVGGLAEITKESGHFYNYVLMEIVGQLNLPCSIKTV